MLPDITLSTGRNTTALGFGCASLMRLPEARDRQRLLDLAVDLGIRHFDGARLYGLGQVEGELGALLRRHSCKEAFFGQQAGKGTPFGDAPPVQHHDLVHIG